MTLSPSSEMARALEMAMIHAAEAARAERYGEILEPHPGGTAKTVHYYAGFEDGWRVSHASLEAVQRERDEARALIRSMTEPNGLRYCPGTPRPWRIGLIDRNRGIEPIDMEDDGTGYPRVTDEARRALDGNHK